MKEPLRGGTKPCWSGKWEIAVDYASRLACRAILARYHITLSLTTRESSAHFEKLEGGRESMAVRQFRRESCGSLGSWVSGVWFITGDGQPTSSCEIVWWNARGRETKQMKGKKTNEGIQRSNLWNASQEDVGREFRAHYCRQKSRSHSVKWQGKNFVFSTQSCPSSNPTDSLQPGRPAGNGLGEWGINTTRDCWGLGKTQRQCA